LISAILIRQPDVIDAISSPTTVKEEPVTIEIAKPLVFHYFWDETLA
jgi:hypothetical protein